MRGHAIHIGLCLLDRDSWFKTADGKQITKVVVHLFRLQHQGHFYAGRIPIEYARAQHADNRIRLAVHLHGVTHHMRVAAQVRPEPMREDYDVAFAFHGFLGEKVPPVQKGLTQHVEVAGANLYPENIFRLIFGGDIEVGVGKGYELLKTGILALPVDEVSSRNAILQALNVAQNMTSCFGFAKGTSASRVA